MHALDMESCIAEGQWGGKDNGILQVSALTEYNSVCNSLSMAWRVEQCCHNLQVALHRGGYVVCLRGHKDLGRRKAEPEAPQFSQGSLITWSFFISGGGG